MIWTGQILLAMLLTIPLPNPLVTAKLDAAHEVECFVCSFWLLAILLTTIAQSIGWGAVNSAVDSRIIGVSAGGSDCSTIWHYWLHRRAVGPAVFAMGAIARAPFYQHPEYLDVLGIGRLVGGVRFAPRDENADSEQLKFNNIMSIIAHRGSYHLWGKSLLYPAASIESRRYIEIRTISDHFENFIEVKYLGCHSGTISK